MAKRLTSEELLATLMEEILENKSKDNASAGENREQMGEVLIPYLKKLSEKYPDQEEIQGINIDDFIMSKDKLSLRFFDGYFDDNVNTPVNLNNGKKPIPVYMTVNYPILNGVKIGNKDLTRYDYAVYNTLVSLYEATEGKKIFSVDTIYRNMIGNPKAKTTEISYKEIMESIRKLSYTSIIINDTNGAKAWGYDTVVTREEAMLMSTIDTLTISGYSKTVVRVRSQPILFWYASLKDQIARVPSYILTTPINKGKEVIALQHYLLERVLAIKGKGMHTSHTIKYSTLYEKMKTSDEVNKPRAREYSKIILDYWKEKDFIKGYQEKRGAKNSLVSITIII